LVDVSIDLAGAVLWCPVDGVRLGEDVESDRISEIVSGTSFVRDWVAVVAVLLTPFHPDCAVDGVGSIVNVVAVNGSPGVVLVHRAPGGEIYIPAGRSSHVLGELGSFSFDKILACVTKGRILKSGTVGESQLNILVTSDIFIPGLVSTAKVTLGLMLGATSIKLELLKLVLTVTFFGAAVV
jgi:hypothetical protein